MSILRNTRSPPSFATSTSSLLFSRTQSATMSLTPISRRPFLLRSLHIRSRRPLHPLPLLLYRHNSTAPTAPTPPLSSQSSLTAAPPPRPPPQPRVLPPMNPNEALVPPPKSGIITERLPNRALPPLPSKWSPLKHFIPFCIVMAISAALLMNYQRSCSPVITGTLFALRRNELARSVLGAEIDFASPTGMPWISGELNQWQGRIDVSWWVGGKRGVGRVVLKARRIGGKGGYFETEKWGLLIKEFDSRDGKETERFVDLLDRTEDPIDILLGKTTVTN